MMVIKLLGGSFIPDRRFGVQYAARKSACISELMKACGIYRLRGILALLINV